MPSFKSSIRSLARATSTATFVNVPRLETPPRYDRWLRRLLVTPQNKKTVETCQKADVDHLFREQASQQFKNESELLERAFAEISSRASQDAWKLAVPDSGVEVSASLAKEVAKLRLPEVAARGQRHYALKLQTYQEFADQAKRNNREVAFNKYLMDESFRTAAFLVSKHAAGGRVADRESMITRCLGKESKEYWKV